MYGKLFYARHVKNIILFYDHHGTNALFFFLLKQAILIQIDNKTSWCLLDFGPGKIFELHITFTREQPERV